MKKYNASEIAEFIEAWELDHGESFTENFIESAISDMSFVVGYILGRFPDLGRMLLKHSNWTIPWKEMDHSDFETTIAEDIYDGSYDEVRFMWASLIHDIDPCYEKLQKWLEKEGYSVSPLKVR